MKIKALKGVQDILPDKIEQWNYVHDLAKKIFSDYGYEQIIIPVIEESSLFTRSIGAQTDIVEKEMYSFVDRGNRTISLRPEATASVVRAFLEHDLNRAGKLKLFYMGPMFRGEKPQAGRNRQFYQIGIEAFGSYSNFLDAEVIGLGVKYLESIGLKDFKVLINSVGTAEDKENFGRILQDFLKGRQSDLCENCNTRYNRNILRVLDCKNKKCKKIIQNAPKIIESLSGKSKNDFERVKAGLDCLQVKYEVSPNLVRGLDYYTKTVFEITHDKLGAQNTILAGGRYDNLVSELGGQPTGAVGFACGVERIILAIESESLQLPISKKSPCFLIGLGEQAYKRIFGLANQLRSRGILTHLDYLNRSLKAQMRLANKAECEFVAILGEDELSANQIQLKNMKNGTQELIELDKFVEILVNKIP
jgi:histidyl-tRNA synthetase